MNQTYSRHVLAGQLCDNLLEALSISLDADGGEEVCDVLGRGRGVAAGYKQEVGSDVLHLGGVSTRGAGAGDGERREGAS